MSSYNDYQQVLFISYRGVVKVMIVHGMGHLGTLQRMLITEKTYDPCNNPPNPGLADRNSTPGTLAYPQFSPGTVYLHNRSPHWACDPPTIV